MLAVVSLVLYRHNIYIYIYIFFLTGCTKSETRNQKEEEDAPVKLPRGEDEEQPSTAAEELQLLDEILSKAQKLRAIQSSEVRSLF